MHITRTARHTYQFHTYRPPQSGNATKSPDNLPLGHIRIPGFPAHKKSRPRINRRRDRASYHSKFNINGLEPLGVFPLLGALVKFRLVRVGKLRAILRP